jgi:hypothetical protein
MLRPPPIPPPRGVRGQISWVTALLLVLLGGGGYLAWIWIPVYVVDFEAKQVVRDYMHQAVKDPDDAGLRERMVARLRLLDTTEAVDAEGQPARLPVVQVAAQDVTWERNREARPPTLRVAFDYVRVVRWPGLDRRTEKTFTVDLTEDVSIPDWGPAR